MRRDALGLLLASGAVLFAHTAASKPFAPGTPRMLPDIEAQVKALSTGTDAPTKFDAFMKWLGLSITCSTADCKTIASTQWVIANLDADAEDERALAITTVGSGTCAPANLELLVFDSTTKGWVVTGHARLHLAGGAKPTSELKAVQVHSAKLKDLVLRVDGQCAGSEREQELRVLTLEGGKLHEIASSADVVGTGMSSYALVGSPPVVIELTDAKGKTKLWFDEGAFGYDALPSYDDALKSSVGKGDDAMLSTKECAAPLSGSLALDCGLEGTAKVPGLVKLGKPVGLTVSSQPAQSSFERCMRKRISTTSWPSATGATGCMRTFAAK